MSSGRCSKTKALRSTRRSDNVSLETDHADFTGELHIDAAPESVAALREIPTLDSELVHVRWSGNAV